MVEDNSFANVLKTFRMRKGKEWTQKKTAHLLNISHRKYVGWENRESFPDERELENIKNLFELNEKDVETLYRARGRVLPEVHNIPFLRNSFFTGRETKLQQLAHLLKENGSVAISQPIAISGLGGIGKTQLALEYAHRSYRSVYRAVFWVKAVDKPTLQAEYDALAQLLKLPERSEREPEQRVQAVKTWLEGHDEWLLILDNADDLQLARSFLPVRPHGGHILLTTRSQIVGTVAKQIEIEEMEPAEGLLFLLKRISVVLNETELDTVAMDVREAAIELVTLLGSHPLALDQAGAYIEETGMSLVEYIQLYQEERQYLLAQRGSSESDESEHPASVVTTVELSVEKACKQQPMAADILYFCSFLQPDAIPEELLQQADALKLDKKSLGEAIKALKRYSLIKQNTQEKTFSMHRLVQAVIIDTMSPDLRKQWRARVIQAVNRAFPEVKFKEWRQCERVLSHALICTAGVEDEFISTLEVSDLLHKVGTYLDERAHYAEAEPLLRRALAIREKHSGLEHPDTAQSLNDLAWLYDHQGRYAEAEPLHQRALVIREKQLGPEHSAVAETLNNLGVLYRHWGKRKEAEPLHRRALAIREKQLGPVHIDTAESLNNLGLLYSDQRRYGEAEPLLKRALENREKRLGGEHPDTAQSLNNLAFLYDLQEKYTEAEPLHRRALAIREKHLGLEHPDTAQSLNNLAWLYDRLGKYEEAEQLYQRTLAIDIKACGPEHPYVAHDLNNLAELYQRQRKYEQAEQSFLRALGIQEPQLGTTHPDTQETRKAYAAFLRLVGRDTEATTVESR